MIYYKSKLNSLIKSFIAVHLLILAVFGMVKCSRISVLTVTQGADHIRDTELLFHIIDFTRVKDYVYNAYLEENRKDKSVKSVSLYLSSTMFFIDNSDMSPTTKLIDDDDLKKSSVNVFKAMSGKQDNEISSGEGLMASASDNLVTFDSPYYNYELVYSVNGLYPDKASFPSNRKVEFVRISLHWFHCYFVTDDFWNSFWEK